MRWEEGSAEKALRSYMPVLGVPAVLSDERVTLRSGMLRGVERVDMELERDGSGHLLFRNEASGEEGARRWTEVFFRLGPTDEARASCAAAAWVEGERGVSPYCIALMHQAEHMPLVD